MTRARKQIQDPRHYLATDGDIVSILFGTRANCDRHARWNGLTILKSDNDELVELTKRGAQVTLAGKE